MPTARHIYATAGEELLKYDSADLSSYVWLVYNSYISGGEEAPVTANDAGTSWLPDQEGHTIMEVTADGTADYEVESVDFEPTAVAADESGNYYVGGVDGHLTKFDEYGKAWASNVSDYEIKALMWHDGRLYASSAIGLTSPESDGGFHYDVDDYMEPMVMASGGGYVYFGGYNSYYEEHELMQFEASALSYNSLDDAGENWRKTFIDSNEFVGLAADSRGVYVSLRYDDLIFFDTDGTQQASRNSLEYTPVHGLGGGDSYTYTSNQAPTAAFAYSKSGGTVDFTDQSSDGDGTVQSYSWDFGDGTTSTQQSPSHTYASSGTYTVSLTVTDDAGATATATQDISVTAVIGGTAALADNGPAPAASGATRNAGASAITEAADVLSLSGALPLSTELALSGKAQALGLQARAPAAGTAALVDTASSFTASSGTTLDQSPFLFHADSELTKAIKRDAKNGDKVWEYVPSAGGVQPLAADQNGNLYVGADDGALLTKVGAAGAKQWTWDGSPAYDDVFAIEILDSGNLAVKAYDGADYYLTEIDAASGTTERERKATHGGSAQNPRSIEAAPNGGLYWSGFTSPFIKRLDSSWNEVWTWTAPAGYEYGPYQLGATSSALYGIADGNVLRVDPTTANTVWVDTIGDRYAGELAVSDSDHIYAAYDASTEDDIVRYSDTGSALFGEWQVFAVEHPNLQADNRGNLFATFNVDPDGDQGTSTGDDDRLQQYAGEGGLEWQKTFYDDYIQEPELQPVPPRVEGAGAFSSRGELLSLVGTTLAAGEAQLASSRETTTIEGAPYVAGSGSSLDAKPALALAGNTSTAIAFDINDKPTAATAAGRANAAATAGLSAAKESLGADGDVSIQAQGAAQSGTADVGAGGGPLATSTLSLTGRAAQVLLVGGPVAGGAGSLAGKPQPIALLGGAAAGGSAG
ncbi:PKD repeat protein, partial [Salinibacter ruber]|uniref:PKD domain-containing protein n=1 Tax=Salinibacter ruber TaxID=146919 RepID=UPI0023431D90